MALAPLKCVYRHKDGNRCQTDATETAIIYVHWKETRIRVCGIHKKKYDECPAYFARDLDHGIQMARAVGKM